MDQRFDTKKEQDTVFNSKGMPFKDKKFVRYIDGAELYSMHPKTFEKLARDANARYKIGKMVLVNTQIIDKYLETCRLIES